jgi:putative phosphoesterase
MSRRLVVGLISHTHGLLRPEAVAILRGSDFIVHAGDVGKPEVLAELGRLAPLTAVRGNVDRASWAHSLPETASLEVCLSTRLYVLHRIADLDLDPVAAGFRVVIFGHSHKAETRWRDGVLYVNPGSAGPRRFSRPITVGRLVVEAGELSVDVIGIETRQ